MHGFSMIKQNDALRIQRLALSAVESLTAALDVSVATASPEVQEELKRGIGITIGLIQTEVLAVLYQFHPDIDPLSK